MINCPLCGSSKKFLLKTIPIARIKQLWKKNYGIELDSLMEREIDSHELHLYRCANCDLDYFYPDYVGTAELYENLSHYKWYYQDEKWEFQEALSDIKDAKSILEIGCGEGNFLSKVKPSGINIYGIELNPKAADEARKKGLTVFNDDLSTFTKKINVKFDCICMFQVLEHLPSVGDFLSEVVNLLSENGKLIITVPYRDGFLSQIDEKLLDMPPHHLTRWSTRTFESIETLFNLKLIKIRYEPITLGHLNWYLSSITQKYISKNFSGSRLKYLTFSTILKLLTKILTPFIYAMKIPDYYGIKGHTVYVVFKKI